MHSRSVMSLEQLILTINTGLFSKYDVFWSNLETKETKRRRWGTVEATKILNQLVFDHLRSRFMVQVFF